MTAIVLEQFASVLSVFFRWIFWSEVNRIRLARTKINDTRIKWSCVCPLGSWPLGGNKCQTEQCGGGGGGGALGWRVETSRIDEVQGNLSRLTAKAPFKFVCPGSRYAELSRI